MQSIRVQVGQRIRELRQTKKWSLEVLGEKADLHPGYVGGIERGERNVSIDNLAKIASAFDLSLAELLELPRGRQTEKKILEANLIGSIRRQNLAVLKFLTSMMNSV